MDTFLYALIPNRNVYDLQQNIIKPDINSWACFYAKYSRKKRCIALLNIKYA